MLIGNRFKIKVTDGRLVWFYSFPQLKSPPRALIAAGQNSYNLQGPRLFFDPLIKQNLPDGMPQDYFDSIENLFWMDFDHRDMVCFDTWDYTQRKTPTLWVPNINTHNFPQPAKAEVYAKEQFSEFWNAILMNSAAMNALQKFTSNLEVPSNVKKGPYA